MPHRTRGPPRAERTVEALVRFFLFPVMGACPMDKDRLCRVINRINDSVFEGESIGEEACEVADQSFPAVRILGDRFRQNFFELLLKFRGELVEILHRLFGESDFI